MKKYREGFSFIEVMISLILLSILLLTFNQFNLSALRQNESAILLNTTVNQRIAVRESSHTGEMHNPDICRK